MGKQYQHWNLRRWIGWLLVSLLVVSAIVYGFRTRPIAVDLALIKSEPLTVWVGDEGRTRIQEIYTVAAPLAGTVRRSPVEVGDQVVLGETVVAIVEPEQPHFLDARSRQEAQAQVAAAEAAVVLARAEHKRRQAELAYWRGELQRAQELAIRRTISPQSLEQTELEVSRYDAGVETAAAEIEMRKRQLESAKARLIEPDRSTVPAVEPSLCCVSVLAPASGRVLSVMVESARVIPAGAELLTIGDAADLEIVVELLSSDAVRVQPGARAVISRWGGNQGLIGIVRHIEPGGFTKTSALGIEEQRVNVIVDLTSNKADWAALGDGYRVFVEIEVWHAKNTVAVPISALFRHEGRWAVFRFEQGHAALAPVEIGERNLKHAEVLTGLAVSDLVIEHPNDGVADGIKVVDRSKLR